MRSTMGIRLMGDPVQTIERLAGSTCSTSTSGPACCAHLIKDGDLTGYGLVNAVTHYAQDVDDYDRATEFEALGGRLLEQGAKEWSELAEAA